MIIPLAILCFFCALVPAVMFAVNLHYYREPPPAPAAATLQAVSILIPARNEAAAIGPALEAALQTRGIAYEIVVMDDNSTEPLPSSNRSPQTTRRSASPRPRRSPETGTANNTPAGRSPTPHAIPSSASSTPTSASALSA
jgi:hypothetical protein